MEGLGQQSNPLSTQEYQGASLGIWGPYKGMQPNAEIIPKPPTYAQIATRPAQSRKAPPNPSTIHPIAVTKSVDETRFSILLEHLGPRVKQFMLPRDEYKTYSSAWLHAYKIRDLIKGNPYSRTTQEGPRSFSSGLGIRDLFEKLYPDSFQFLNLDPHYHKNEHVAKFCQDMQKFLQSNIKLSRSSGDKVHCYYCKEPDHIMSACEILQEKIRRLKSPYHSHRHFNPGPPIAMAMPKNTNTERLI